MPDLRFTNLAPAIQEDLLLLPNTLRSPDRITEKLLRGIVSLVDWEGCRALARHNIRYAPSFLK